MNQWLAFVSSELHRTFSPRLFHDPNLSAFMTRVAARPKVREALKAEGLIGAG